ncbi:MAG: phosphoglucosamine mutase [Candidatus Fimadaptatus sp.]|jgi:phosphoglucosamine mutase
MARYFGTDGIRGIAGRELDYALSYRLGWASARALAGGGGASLLVGRDTRASGGMLEAGLVAGICDAGAEALVAGVLPTPAVALLVRQYGADAGVVISASHNPAEYNGIKLFGGTGMKLSRALEDSIERHMDECTTARAHECGRGAAGERARYIAHARSDYIAALTQGARARLNGLHAVLDCANGAASLCAGQVLRRLGARTTVLSNQPDGYNINAGCGALHTQKLRRVTAELGADVGLAFDGDADRLIAVDERGVELDGDRLLAIIGLDMQRRGALRGGAVVSTVMSNAGLERALGAHGLANPRAQVGDSNVLELMLERGCNLGGEQSGHIILLDRATTGDGILTATELMAIMATRGRRLSELAECMRALPQTQVNARVSAKGRAEYAADGDIARRIAEIERRYAGRGRLLVRASGTEPLVRIMAECEDADEACADAHALGALIESRFPPDNS